MNPRKVINVNDLRAMARRRLPRPVFDLVDGGAEDEITSQRNIDAFRSLRVLPTALAAPEERDLSATIFDQRVAAPILLAPTGAARVLHRDAELAVARAAAARDVAYVHGMVSGFTLEEVGAAAPAARWFQLYLSPDRDALRALLDRVREAGYRVLVVTVDSAVFGNRERDRRNGFTVPMRFGPRIALRSALHPGWAASLMYGQLVRRGARQGRVTTSQMQRDMLRSLYPVTARDLAQLRASWQGPLVVKGVLRPEDATALIDHGVDGVVVSNHGGRQLDRAPATIEVLGGIVAEVAGRAEIFLDGGVRRGIDVLAALALGARAVLVARPYLYGLAVGGQAGVERVIELLAGELDRAMALAGCARLADIDDRLLASDDGCARCRAAAQRTPAE